MLDFTSREKFPNYEHTNLDQSDSEDDGLYATPRDLHLHYNSQTWQSLSLNFLQLINLFFIIYIFFQSPSSFKAPHSSDSKASKTKASTGSISIEVDSRQYPIDEVEEFFWNELGIKYPVVLAEVPLAEQGYQDVGWWVQAQNESNTLTDKEGLAFFDYTEWYRQPCGVEGVYSPDMFRPMATLTNYHPLVYRYSSWFLAFNGSACKIAGGSPYDYWCYCGYSDRSTVHKCLQGEIVRDGKWTRPARPKYLKGNDLVICPEDQSADKCLQTMYKKWPKDNLWLIRGEPHNQIQSRCKKDALVACSYSADSEYEKNKCLWIREKFPGIRLITTHYVDGFKVCNESRNERTPECFTNRILKESRGFQSMKIVTDA